MILRSWFYKGWITKKSDRLILPGTQSQHQSSAAWLRMAGSALTWAVASSHYRCGVKSVWSSRRLPVFSKMSTDGWYLLRGPAFTKVVYARRSAKLCLCSQMLESPGTVSLTTSWACWGDTGCGLFLSLGLESLIRWNLKGNSHWLQSFYIRADNESDIRRQVSRIQELFCNRFAKPEIKLSTIFAAKLSLKNWYYSWI